MKRLLEKLLTFIGFGPSPCSAAWECLACGKQNPRDHEGLDECEKCGAETATYYAGERGEELRVKFCRPNHQCAGTDASEKTP